jgi:DNA polymerase III delta prime subunit
MSNSVVFSIKEHPRHHGIYDQETESLLQRIEWEYQARDELAHHGLRPRRAFLFYGAAGCGKTLAAERLAFNIGLRLIVLRDPLEELDGEDIETILRESRAKGASLVLIEDFSLEKEPRRALSRLKHLLNESENSPSPLMVILTTEEAISSRVTTHGPLMILDGAIGFDPPRLKVIVEIIKGRLLSVTHEEIDESCIPLVTPAVAYKVAHHLAVEAIREGKSLTKKEIRNAFSEVGCTFEGKRLY